MAVPKMKHVSTSSRRSSSIPIPQVRQGGGGGTSGGSGGGIGGGGTYCKREFQQSEKSPLGTVLTGGEEGGTTRTVIWQAAEATETP